MQNLFKQKQHQVARAAKYLWQGDGGKCPSVKQLQCVWCINVCQLYAKWIGNLTGRSRGRLKDNGSNPGPTHPACIPTNPKNKNKYDLLTVPEQKKRQ